MAETDQILVMNNERFAVPELLFRPDDIGLDQAGLAATIAHSISQLPIDLQGMFWSNIGLIGGNAKFPGFRQRLLVELQTLAPVECEVVIYECKDPITEAYQSAHTFVTQSSASGSSSAGGEGFAQRAVTRSEYMESGNSASRRKFKDWKSVVDSEKDAQSHKDAPAIGNIKDMAPKEGAKGRGKHQREESRSVQRRDDRSPAVPNPIASTSRLTRTRTTRAGGTANPN